LEKRSWIRANQRLMSVPDWNTQNWTKMGSKFQNQNWKQNWLFKNQTTRTELELGFQLFVELNPNYFFWRTGTGGSS
jgi:hypothetical protein